MRLYVRFGSLADILRRGKDMSALPPLATEASRIWRIGYGIENSKGRGAGAMGKRAEKSD